MSRQGDSGDTDGAHERRIGAPEKPSRPAKTKPTREERLAKALRDNLRRRKAADKKD
jgi:hypothetical protein